MIIDPNASEKRSKGGIILPPAPEIVISETQVPEELKQALIPPEFQGTGMNVPIIGQVSLAVVG